MSEALEVGTRLVELCQQGKANEAMEELYSDEIVSIEGVENEHMPARIEGIDGVRKKVEWWEANHEVHGIETVGPFVGHRDDQFAVEFHLDTTPKGGERMQMREVGLYTVAGGKVVQEEFLYLMA